MQNEIKAPIELLNSEGILNNPGWARKLFYKYNPEKLGVPGVKAKEWDYYFVGNENVGIALTINDFQMFSMLSVSLLKFDEQLNITKNSYLKGTIHQPLDDKGTCYIRTADGECAFIRKGIHTYLRAKMENFDDKGHAVEMNIVLTMPESDHMVIATPFKEDPHFFYLNEKINNFRAEGYVQLGDYRHDFIHGRDFAVLDWGRGVWPDHNRWYWGSASGELGGKDFGFNIGYGFGDLSNATENMIFYDGTAHKFGGMTFDIPKEGFTAGDWHIYSDDGRFDMQFAPILDRMALKDVSKEPGSLQHQVFGRYTGKAVLDDGTILEIKDYFGFAEDVTNNWAWGR